MLNYYGLTNVIFLGSMVGVVILVVAIKLLKNVYIFNRRHKKLFRYLDNVNPDKDSNYAFKSRKKAGSGFSVRYKVINELIDIDYIMKNEQRIKDFLGLSKSYKILPSANYETLTIIYQQLKDIVYSNELLKKGFIFIGSKFGGIHYLPISKISHSLIIGMPGAGKSNMINTIFASIAYNLDFTENYFEKVYFVDFKIIEAQKFRNLHPKIKTVIDFKEFYDCLKDLEDKLNVKTAQMLENNQLKIENELNLLIIDEATDFFSAYNSANKKNSPDEYELLQNCFNILSAIVRKGRAFNIMVWLCSQKSSGEQINTSIRDLLINRYCLKTTSPELVLDSFYKELPKYGANPNNFVAGEVFCYEPTNDNFAGLVKCPYSKDFENNGYLADILNIKAKLNKTAQSGVFSLQANDNGGQANNNPNNANNANNKSANTHIGIYANADIKNNTSNNQASDYTVDFKQDYNISDYTVRFKAEYNFDAYKALYDKLSISKKITCKDIIAYEKLVARFENHRAQMSYLDSNIKFVKILVAYGSSEYAAVCDSEFLGSITIKSRIKKEIGF